MMNKQGLTIVCTAKMGHGTFEAKFYPIVGLEMVKEIIIVRKDLGPHIPKVSYKILPGICNKKAFNLLIAPIVLLNTTLKAKADLILAYHYLPHFYFAYFVSLLTKIPYVVGQTGTDVQSLGEKPIRGFLIRHIVRKAHSFNVPGKATYDYWLSKKVPSKTLRVLHSTINTDIFKPNDADKMYDLIFVGRLSEVKRLDKLILAAAAIVQEFSTLKICIVGSGHLEKTLKQMVAEYHLEKVFDFVGLQSNISEWLNKAQAFVMTSDSEGLPCAMMEAMSCGLVCIGPNVNNMADLLVDDMTGYLFDTSDVGMLASRIKHVLRNYNNLAAMRASARELIVTEHSYQVAKRIWLEVFAEL
jgi:glycosyltransferase involved in cell wall biosynthesis